MSRIRNKIFNKHSITFIACISIFFSTVFGINVNAADAHQMKAPLFTDVNGGESYYDDLKFLVELDIIDGFPDGSYAPNKTVSRAEFIKMLVIATNYTLTKELSDAGSFKDTDSHWSAAYVNTAIANKIIGQDSYGAEFFPDRPITRQEMAAFMINALNIYQYTPPSLYSDTDNEYVNLASGEYLLLGYSENGNKIFKPQDNLIRADVCRVIARTIQYREDAEAYKNKMILEFVKDNIITTQRQMYDLLRACTMNFIDKIEVKINLSDSEVEDAFNMYIALNPEKPTIRTLNYVSDGIPWHFSQLTFNYDLSRDEEERRAKEIDIVAENFVKEYIRPDMTDMEKVTEIHNYIVLNCEYDTRYRYTDVADIVIDETTIDIFTAYGALVNNMAVCQGYSAAFNVLAKKAGIASIAVSGTPPRSAISHMWNMVSIDGVIYFVDTTWDDPVPEIKGQFDTKYLLKTEQEFADFGYKWSVSYAKKEYLNK